MNDSNKYQSVALPSSRTIASLYSSMKNGSLEVQPDFQRKLVWNDRHKAEFIDTILRNYPFPEVYIANKDINTVIIEPKEVVVDGQQRLTSIIEYVEGYLKIPQSIELTPYSELSETKRQAFLNYPVTVRQLTGVGSEEIKEIFKRINQTQYALNAFEITHAVYDGEFMSAAKQVCELESFKQLPTFKDRDISRMGDLGFVLLVMSTVEHGGYFTYDKEIERYIRDFDNEYPNRDTCLDTLNSTFESIVSADLGDDSMWYRKSNIFTLVVESLAAKGLPDRQKLLDFEGEINEARQASKNNENIPGDFGAYYRAMYTGTNSKNARSIRGDIFRKYMY